MARFDDLSVWRSRGRKLLFLLALATAASTSPMLSNDAAANSDITYTYDALGRLLTTTYSNGVIVTYTYDAADNRTAVVTTTYTPMTWTATTTPCTANCWEATGSSPSWKW